MFAGFVSETRMFHDLQGGSQMWSTRLQKNCIHIKTSLGDTVEHTRTAERQVKTPQCFTHHGTACFSSSFLWHHSSWWWSAVINQMQSATKHQAWWRFGKLYIKSFPLNKFLCPPPPRTIIKKALFSVVLFSFTGFKWVFASNTANSQINWYDWWSHGSCGFCRSYF